MGFNQAFADSVLRSRNRSLFDPSPVPEQGNQDGARSAIGAAVGSTVLPASPPAAPVTAPIPYGQDLLPAGTPIPPQLQGMTPETMSAMAHFLDGVANQNRENEAMRQILGSSKGYLGG